MYGTIARMKINPGNLDELRKVVGDTRARDVPGYRSSHLLIPDDWNDEVWLVAIFDDKDSYEKNADDPAQHEEYLRYRALLDADPVWTDGQIESSTA